MILIFNIVSFYSASPYSFASRFDRFGVDGIITNHPERLYTIIKEPNFRFKYRLATQEDDPWERLQSDPEEKPAPSANDMQPVSLRVVTSAADMLTSFTKYLRDFVFLRLPFLRQRKHLHLNQLSELMYETFC